MESSSHLLSCIPSVSVLLLVSDSPYLLSFVLVYAFALGVRLAPVVARSHSFYPWSSCVRGDAPVAVVILHCLYYHVARIELDSQNQRYIYC